MIRKRRVFQNRSLGVITFIVTLLIANLHQKFVLEPMVTSVKARQVADFVTSNLQARIKSVPESKTWEASIGLDALLQEKLQALLTDSQMPQHPPIIRTSYH